MTSNLCFAPWSEPRAKALVLFALLLLLVGVPAHESAAAPSEYVIQISVDGLGSIWLQPFVAHGLLPNFKRFQTEGAWTNNARDDYDVTVTLPNHVCMITARAVCSHHWTGNGDPGPGQVLHDMTRQYVASVFDVAHDRGLRTAMFASKSKFSLFQVSYDGAHGGNGGGRGRKKIDTYVCCGDSGALVKEFTTAMAKAPFHYSFVHFSDPDSAGHGGGWGGSAYNQSLEMVDGYLGSIFQMVDSTPALRGKTTIILTSDHGGNGGGHGDITDPCVYTIPFYVWGPRVAPGKDLYALNPATRRDPGVGRPSYDEPRQPIRHADGANLALAVLGLAPIPGSTVNARQDLALGKRLAREVRVSAKPLRKPAGHS